MITTRRYAWPKTEGREQETHEHTKQVCGSPMLPQTCLQMQPSLEMWLQTTPSVLQSASWSSFQILLSHIWEAMDTAALRPNVCNGPGIHTLSLDPRWTCQVPHPNMGQD